MKEVHWYIVEDYYLDLQSCNVVKVVYAGGPDPQTLLAIAEQE